MSTKQLKSDNASSTDSAEIAQNDLGSGDIPRDADKTPAFVSDEETEVLNLNSSLKQKENNKFEEASSDKLQETSSVVSSDENQLSPRTDNTPLDKKAKVKKLTKSVSFAEKNDTYHFEKDGVDERVVIDSETSSEINKNDLHANNDNNDELNDMSGDGPSTNKPDSNEKLDTQEATKKEESAISFTQDSNQEAKNIQRIKAQ